MQISIIGIGYVGLVTGTCLANFGLSVTCVDNDNEKNNFLNNGKLPIHESNLEELIQKNVEEKRLSFTTDMKKAVEESQVIYIAVGTPSNHDGSASMQQVEGVAREIAKYINGYKIIVNKCTAPVGTARKIKQIITEYQISNGHCERSDEAILSFFFSISFRHHPQSRIPPGRLSLIRLHSPRQNRHRLRNWTSQTNHAGNLSPIVPFRYTICIYIFWKQPI